ncbi:hypothetical protein DW352_19800 [Pseudolabrys taiwanensis]|uniref:Uncharacterized protein n=1 Tax=Pseudolabrys taiwanensis TaxID=331696 RepID=A0A346A069_9HYPH|nr:hypothetical protein [Pseudolabrys taiwanensis]AXK82566.1 hypothetical protein DW352_19800 [Pseudolabrys taiwanensis]
MGLKLPGIVVIGAALAAPIAFVQGAAQAADAFATAERIIKQHRLLTPQQQKCSKLVLREDSNKRIAKVGIYERHDATCGGDPDAEHRLFDMEINMRSGAATWDNNVDMEMRPVPARRR